MKKRVAGLLLAGVAVTGIGMGSATAAFAEPTATPTDTPTAGATPGATTGHQNHRGPGRGAPNADLAKQLAEKLGIDEAKVTEALKAVRTEHSPAKSDQTQKGQTQNGQTPSDQKPDPTARDTQLAKNLADKLGIDEAKVNDALTAIREARQAEQKTAFSTKLDTAVTDGKLTRAEADAVLKAAEAGVIPMGGHGR